jgi:hypothetical protein
MKVQMKIHIELLRRDKCNLPVLLEKDGWTLENRDGCFSVSHPDVPDEIAARTRLYHLGLLTSPTVRIEFKRSKLKHVEDFRTRKVS